MNFVFLMNPLEQVKPKKDTSFAFMHGAQRREHQIFCMFSGGISLQGSQILFDVLPVQVAAAGDSQPFRCAAPARFSLDQVDAIFIRTDPPFDERYLLDTWLLDRAAQHCPVINEPAGLRAVNEKLWATQFTDLVPTTLVSARRDLFDAFLEEHGEIAAKPTNAFGGAGVFRVRRGDTNTSVVWETLTRFGRSELIAQPFLAEADIGDKRILLLAGEPLGAVLRVHAPTDHRNNFFAGGKPHAADITPDDQRIIAALRPELLRLGLHFVGIDVIGTKLMEVNVTSPTCLQEINHFCGEQLEDRVIEYVEKLVERRRAGGRT